MSSAVSDYNTRVTPGGILRFIWKSLTGAPRMLNIGEKAPAFDTTDQHGHRVRLEDFRGRKVVLWFFPKANTSG
jgi:peroxiredoxin